MVIVQIVVPVAYTMDQKMINLILKLLGWRECPFCGRYRRDVGVRRLNTAYNNDILNYQESCEDCYNYSWNYYTEMWETYRRERC